MDICVVGLISFILFSLSSASDGQTSVCICRMSVIFIVFPSLLTLILVCYLQMGHTHLLSNPFPLVTPGRLSILFSTILYNCDTLH